MTSAPATVMPDESLDHLLDLMGSHAIRHVPVLDDDGALVGVVSDRDLLRSTGCLPRRVHAARGPYGAAHVPRTVAEVASAPVVTIEPDATAEEAVLELMSEGIGCLPVVEGDAVVGILTELDVIEAYQAVVSELDPDESSDPDVDVWMTEGVTTIEPTQTLGEAVDLMHVQAVRHLPVVLEGELLGLVSDRDLRRARGVGRPDDMSIEDVMARDLVTIASSDRVSTACRRLIARRISALPVVDDGMFVGILTTSDLLDLCLDHLRETDPSARDRARSA